MLVRFYLLVFLLRSIRALDVSNTVQAGSFSSYGGANFSILTSNQPVINDCPYNITYRTGLDYDSSSCVNFARENSGSTQFPNVDKFVKNFTNTMQSNPSLQRFFHMDIPVSQLKDISYKIDYKLLKDIGHPMPEILSNGPAQTLAFYDAFTLTVYFKIVGNLLAKFLQTENIALGYSVIRCYSYLVEKALESTCIVDGETLYQALVDAFVNSVKSFDINFLDKLDLLLQMFISELLRFAKGGFNQFT